MSQNDRHVESSPTQSYLSTAVRFVTFLRVSRRCVAATAESESKVILTETYSCIQLHTVHFNTLQYTRVQLYLPACTYPTALRLIIYIIISKDIQIYENHYKLPQQFNTMMIHTYRSCLRNLRISLARNYVSGSKLVDVTRDDKTGVSHISMSRAPVNGLNREMLVELRKSLEEAQNERRKGVVLTSSLPTVFSGGLDIMEMYKKDAESMSNFWSALQDLYLTLYGLSVPIAAAINGSSPAGGCFLAMCCEYRVFVDGKHTIGLNETNLGIVAPKWFQKVMIATIGHRNAELALLRGTLFSPQEALRIGLVDDLATDKADAISKCENYIASFARIPAKGRYFTKLAVRHELIQWMHDNRETDVDNFVTFAQAPDVQKNLELYIQSLKKR